ncbi:hypothetical protein L861_09670 [Litchfieldella anticariensis FP35 = DSM 16096]|uniref:Uncharacterized protein n=2 Tax=Litchfieldella anticariensis TaxID=258591 RepID=S2LCU5_LITA3|nr:hypothetical protein [Halomonas anticariensis]EPC02601.1 hypothetical protein L861_09670 [Halomonas anticariensis FP35 = DSM 16096]
MRAWDSWLRSFSFVLVISWALTGCGGDGGNSSSNNEEEETATSMDDLPDEGEPTGAEVNEEKKPEVAPFSEPVEITAEGDQLADRRLRVEGQTNLPDETELLIVVERQTSGVRWRIRTSVDGGHFSAEPFGPGSGLPDGEYSITVSVQPASVQPQSVRAVIGEQGEHLSGPLTSKSRHRGTTAEYSTSFTAGTEPGIGT